MQATRRSMKADISILLPTRGRTDMLRRSLFSLVDQADDASRIEFRLAFDDDDMVSAEWFEHHIAPHLDDLGAVYTSFAFPRLGYTRLNEYINALAKDALGRWLFFWGDDGIMHTKGWDTKIAEVWDFRVLRIPTHNCHPYAIWPIIPKQWFDIIGHFSPHSLSDSWVSQIAFMLDIMHNLEIEATHDRFDLTGNNHDNTFKQRTYFEGNPKDPRDFNHIDWRNRRWVEAQKIAAYLRSQGEDTTWFDRVTRGEQNPWEKMCSAEFDPNHQVTQFS